MATSIDSQASSETIDQSAQHRSATNDDDVAGDVAHRRRGLHRVKQTYDHFAQSGAFMAEQFREKQHFGAQKSF